MTHLTDKDLELAKKYSTLHSIPEVGKTILEFTPSGFLAFLAERDQLAIKEKDDKKQQALELLNSWLELNPTMAEALAEKQSFDAVMAEINASRSKEKDDAVREALEKAANLCESISNDYYKKEHHRMPELKTDAEAGASDCEYAIRTLIEPKPSQT